MPLRRAVGVLGRAETAEVDEHGTIHGVGDSWRVGWSVGDVEGRWRDPEVDASVRWRAIDDTPVFETAMRVNGGDVRQRVLGAVDRDEVFVAVEVENDSPHPIAVAFSRDDSSPPLVTARRPPAEPDVFPLPHRAVLRVALPLSSPSGAWSERMPTAAQVSAGWRAVRERGERLDVPGPWAGQFALAHAQLLLTWRGDPSARLLAEGARWRLAHDSRAASHAEVAVLAQRVADHCRADPTARDRAALVEARALLSALRDERAAADVGRVLDLVRGLVPDEPSDAASVVAQGRAMVVGDQPRRVVDLLPAAAEWEGADLAVHHIPSRWGEVSFAVRWHGMRPALLWEVEPDGRGPVTVRASALDPAWRSDERSGEALLAGVSAT
ncbi:MAG TPA: hypothetical protein VMK16_07530 [Acidimicrobiales bacterium]|nr:hypothetical protein [Acidimicrobiales bacterium]